MLWVKKMTSAVSHIGSFIFKCVKNGNDSEVGLWKDSVDFFTSNFFFTFFTHELQDIPSSQWSSGSGDIVVYPEDLISVLHLGNCENVTVAISSNNQKATLPYR